MSSRLFYNTSNGHMCIEATGDITAKSGKRFSRVQFNFNGDGSVCTGINSSTGQWEPFK